VIVECGHQKNKFLVGAFLIRVLIPRAAGIHRRVGGAQPGFKSPDAALTVSRCRNAVALAEKASELSVNVARGEEVTTVGRHGEQSPQRSQGGCRAIWPRWDFGRDRPDLPRSVPLSVRSLPPNRLNCRAFPIREAIGHSVRASATRWRSTRESAGTPLPSGGVLRVSVGRCRMMWNSAELETSSDQSRAGMKNSLVSRDVRRDASEHPSFQ